VEKGFNAYTFNGHLGKLFHIQYVTSRQARVLKKRKKKHTTKYTFEYEMRERGGGG
jgi:hypothetical protein